MLWGKGKGFTMACIEQSRSLKQTLEFRIFRDILDQMYPSQMSGSKMSQLEYPDLGIASMLSLRVQPS